MSKDGWDTASLISLENSHCHRTALYREFFPSKVVFFIYVISCKYLFRCKHDSDWKKSSIQNGFCHCSAWVRCWMRWCSSKDEVSTVNSPSLRWHSCIHEDEWLGKWRGILFLWKIVYLWLDFIFEKTKLQIPVWLNNISEDAFNCIDPAIGTI